MFPCTRGALYWYPAHHIAHTSPPVLLGGKETKKGQIEMTVYTNDSSLVGSGFLKVKWNKSCWIEEKSAREE